MRRVRALFDNGQSGWPHGAHIPLRVSGEDPTIHLLERLFGEGKRHTKVIPRFTSESSGLTLLFAVFVDTSEGWRGVRMPAYIVERLEQITEHPGSEWEDLDLMKLAA
ncbi:MAG: hypothetical protein K8G79_05585 [bacterium]|uniref:Uncharacterized protein n=1 Tax=Candidatus Methylomirabilis tolerans TaxID=3123416 RepID=A0AAJ1AJF7_9BACT|nr:hypothetical protein [Candidatus Methylomirabilis sp.]